MEEGLKGDEWVVVEGVLKAIPGRRVNPEKQAAVKTPAAKKGAAALPCWPKESRLMISRFFVERPILANVIAVVTIILGLVCFFILPVAQYPNVVPPTIQVTTRYPGASAQVIAQTVGIPIEQAVNGVENAIYLSSTSGSDGSYTLTVTFDVGTDLNTGLTLVQNHGERLPAPSCPWKSSSRGWWSRRSPPTSCWW